MVRYVQTFVVEQDFRGSDSHDIDYKLLFLPQMFLLFQFQWQ